MRYINICILLAVTLLCIGITNATIVDFHNTTDNTSSIYSLIVTFNSTTPTDPIISRIWNFGDNYTSTEVNPTHYYSVAGVYNVSGSFVNSTGTTIVNKTFYINLTSDTDRNLRSWMHFDGAEGNTTVKDETGLAISTSLVSMTQTQKVFGNASLSFGNDKSYISTPASPIHITAGNFTIEMWAYPTSTSTNSLLLTKCPDNNLNAGWGIYQPSGTTSVNWRFFMGGITNTTNAFTLPLNQWSHLAIVRSNDVLKIYVNGSLVTSQSMPGDFDDNYSYRVGYRSGGTNSFRGYLDEFRVSTYARWESNFSLPTTQYKGDIWFPYPDINPDSTYRFKTDTPAIALIANHTSDGTRNRTIQIQYINNATYAMGTMTFNPLNLYLRNVYPNYTYYNDVSFVSYTIDNTYGIFTFNITRPAGFSNGVNRASIIDTEILYWNYTPNGTASTSFFGRGYLLNGSTGVVYTVHNFIETVLTYGGWDTFGNFTISDNTPTAFETPVVFIPELNYTGNRFLWDFGDGNTFLSYNQTTIHIYNTTGLMNVTLTTYLWQNESVTNTSTLVYAVNASYNTSYISTNFTSNITAGHSPLVVQFNDTTIISPDHWTWDFGDGNFSPSQNPVYTYYYTGNYTVELTSSNSDNSDIETKVNYIWVQSEYPRSSIQNRMVDTQMYVYIGALLIIVLLIIGFVVKILLPNE